VGLLGLSVRECWLIALWFVLLLGVGTWYRPDWLSSALARLRVWKVTSASYRPASVEPTK
jgi:hypothetical protein